jgi:hypothetical protein
MGGTTQQKNTTTAQNQTSTQTQQQQQQSQQQQQQSGATSSALTPWAGNAGLLNSIFSQLGGIPTNLAGAESDALNRWGVIASGGNPYAPTIGGVANTLLSGGGPDRSGIATDAYNQFLAGITPTARGDYLDPATNPFFMQTVQAIGNDVESRLKGMYDAAGRDAPGAGNFGYQLAKGIGEATAPVFANAWSGERGNQTNALNAITNAQRNIRIALESQSNKARQHAGRHRRG